MGAILSHENYLDSATLTVIVGNTMARAIGGVKTPYARGMARTNTQSGGQASLVVDIDLGSVKDILTLGAIGLNASSDAALTWYLSTAASAGGTEIATLTGSWKKSWLLPFSQNAWVHAEGVTPWQARYIRLSITVDRPVSEEWLDVRRLWVGGGEVLADGIDREWRVDQIDATQSERTGRGGIYVDPQQRWRRLSGSITNASADEMLGDPSGTPGAWGVLQTVGLASEVVITPRANAGTNSNNHRDRHLQTIYGVLAQTSPLVASGVPYSTEIAVEEIPAIPLS